MLTSGLFTVVWNQYCIFEQIIGENISAKQYHWYKFKTKTHTFYPHILNIRSICGPCAQSDFKLQAKVVKNVKFEVITKMSSLSPRLAIPMLQTVINHPHWSLFVCFLRGVPFPLLTSGRLLLLLITGLLLQSAVNIHIEFSKPVKYDFQTHDENKTITLTGICKARA